MRARAASKGRCIRWMRHLLRGVAVVTALLVLTALSWIGWTVPKPWREGVRVVGSPCTQRFIGSALASPGAVIDVTAEPGEACGYAIAARTPQARGAQYTLAMDQGSLADGTSMLVSLTAYDGWRRLDRVRRRLDGPADLARLQLSVNVSPRATLVEVSASVRGGGSYAMRGLRLLRKEAAPVSGAALYREAADVVAAHALHAASLPADFRERWQPPPDATPEEARIALRDVLKALGDGHSFMIDPDRLAYLPRQEQAVFRLARFRMLEGNLGYLEIPALLGSDPVLAQRYIASITHSLYEGSRAGARGWVVDLRANRGGNMWPMLAGLEPLLRGQTLGWFQYRDGTRRAWRNETRDPAAAVGDLGRLPVAVLLSRNTASSGEAVAVAFRGRPETRSFGTPTRGLSTGNAGYPLQDGTVLQLTTTVFVDRLQTVHGGPIAPDQRTAALGTDAEAEAIAWLRAQH